MKKTALIWLLWAAVLASLAALPNFERNRNFSRQRPEWKAGSFLDSVQSAQGRFGLAIADSARVDTARIAHSQIDSLVSLVGSRGLKYTDLFGLPTIPAAQVNADWTATSGVAEILNKPTTISAAQVTKLAGVESHAEVNPPRVRKFALIDASTVPASNLTAGKLGLYAGDTQVQNGSIGQADTIFVAVRGADFGQDPTDPTTNLSAQDLSDFFGDAVAHGGSLLLALRQGAQIAYVQAETVAEYRQGSALKGWKLSHLSWVNAFAPPSEGVNWQIVAGFTFGYLLQDGLGTLTWQKLAGVPDFVTDEELRGRESDRYASYTNAFIAAGYRRGAMSLFTQSTGPPTDAHAVGQPDIADRATDGIIAVSTFLRTDRDPNALVWGCRIGGGRLHYRASALYLGVGLPPSARKGDINVQWHARRRRRCSLYLGDRDVGRGRRHPRRGRLRELFSDR